MIKQTNGTTSLMTRVTALTIAGFAAFASTGFAQDTTAPATEESLPMGEPVAANTKGQPYTLETHGDWEVRCIKTDTGNDPCNLYQLLSDENGNSVAEITMFQLNRGDVDAAVTVVTPLETMLTEPLRVQVDEGEIRGYPYQFCNPVGCYVRFGLTTESVNAYKNGNAAKVGLVPMAQPDQPVTLAMSLRGFTAGYEAVIKLNADN